MLESIGSTLPLTSTYFTSLNLVDCRLLERFERAGIKNLTDLSLYSPLELSLKFRLSFSQSEEILTKLFSTLSIRAKTAFDLLIETTSSYIPTKLPTLNQYLNGGLRRGSLVELCGSWGRYTKCFHSLFPLILGSGKTQFCLHLTAQCCLMGLRSIYIDSEHTFSSMRLLSMIGGFDSQREQLLELVRTETVFDSESLLNVLTMIENELEEYVQNKTIDQLPVLLIIDSIAAPLRMTMMNYSRENILLLVTDCVKRLARKYNLLILGNINTSVGFSYQCIFVRLIVVTNQVTTKRRSNVLSEKTNEKSSSCTKKDLGNDFYMSIALGKAWSYSVNVRLAISYRGDKRRELIIGKSIESPGYTIAFQILTDGIEEIDHEKNQHTQRKSFNHQAVPRLIQADEMQLIGKQLRP